MVQGRELYSDGRMILRDFDKFGSLESGDVGSPSSLLSRVKEEWTKKEESTAPSKGKKQDQNESDDTSNGQLQANNKEDQSSNKNNSISAATSTGGEPPKVSERPAYTRREVSKHNSREKGIWVIHDQGVYDITEFVNIHPGGERILLAAGRSIDPFWAVFAIHQSKETRELLETYRIGDLVPPRNEAERIEVAKQEADDKKALAGLFANDPKRDPSLIVRAACPCNAETPATELQKGLITPNEKFFVRNHLPVPKVDEAAFRLEVEGPEADAELSLDQLRNEYPKVDVTVTLQCAGNRRKEMHEVKPVKGLQWEQGAISTAVWSGARLRDVLARSGYDTDKLAQGLDEDVQHVQFHGSEGYGASIPVRKALSQEGDVILAYEMNGEPIPADHGAPIRVVVPGHVAARSVKWCDRITLSDEESTSHWQRKDYKGFNPSVQNVTAEDYEKATSIQELPIQSAILHPLKNEQVTLDKDNTLAVKGYAVSGGGRRIVRVDVSIDGGQTWQDAKLSDTGSRWAWAQWDVRLPVSEEIKSNGGQVEVICKAVDDSYNSQPEGMMGIWNQRGVLVNAWHRVPILVMQTEKTEESVGR
ncbi:Oxidoreductase, molybdopterin-binding domain-containing protein [Phlyctochytrium arcticum]|nr:Oxidoreductase, molybdopterin-binding domain-containing protein [Phlyctochytrium arcticum]